MIVKVALEYKQGVTQNNGQWAQESQQYRISWVLGNIQGKKIFWIVFEEDKPSLTQNMCNPKTCSLHNNITTGWSWKQQRKMYLPN